MKIRVGDRVAVTTGKDRGREGKVLRVIPRSHGVVVEGVNKYKKHVKPRGKDQPGSIKERERPLPLANVTLVCPKCGRPTRVGYTVNKEGKKVRTCKKCKKEVG